MLELKNITKIYETEDLKQKALDNVSVNFRKNEFASILGQSGSGKTTLLNIIGGLDNYTSGNLIINEVSTKKYKDRDWDSYRNHRVGFVFQSYNLISHQSILANVELALTLSGVSKSERKKRAKEALIQVGLKEHMNKRPNQLSGGQMQRVAIARALVNNPDIVLADEPTGALDSETSIQIMELLKKVALDKLVIMVTHNPELAENYSTRIIRLKDGSIIDDSNPYDGREDTENDAVVENGKTKKTSMNILTALSLSLNNLLTKKGRTILTAFAGSIGIIGIALILSLSNGVQNYINRVQEDTLSSYPVSVETASVDMSSMMSSMAGLKDKVAHDFDKVYSNNIMTNMMDNMVSGISTNNLTEFKKYIESDQTNIKDYVNDIKYSYNVELKLYKSDTSKGIVQVSPVTVFDNLGMGNAEYSMKNNPNATIWTELSDNKSLLESQYDIVAGALPSDYTEVVLILDENNEISDYALYGLGIKDQSELMEMLYSSIQGGEFINEETNYTYDEIMNLTFKLILNTDVYTKQDGLWQDQSSNIKYMSNLVNEGKTIKISGIIKPKEDANIGKTTGGMGYTSSLTKYLIDEINNSDIVKEQQSNDKINVLTGMEFNGEDTYQKNLTKLGVVDLKTPSAINLYPKSFDSKDEITRIIDDYNKIKKDENKEDEVISYTDYVGLLMSSVTTIVNIISYVLIAFVSISLIVSSIMIGIITYISVLERTKEIGILRAIGASKKDISRVFNAETFIVGLFAGLIGIGVTILLNIPINSIIKNLSGIKNIAGLPWVASVILIGISMILTIVAGLIPSKMASKKDPVEALRSE